MVNANSVTETFMNLSKPFMKKELVSKVRITRMLRNLFLQKEIFVDLIYVPPKKRTRTLSVSAKGEDVNSRKFLA
jgi:hypothetical protein